MEITKRVKVRSIAQKETEAIFKVRNFLEISLAPLLDASLNIFFFARRKIDNDPERFKKAETKLPINT